MQKSKKATKQSSPKKKLTEEPKLTTSPPRLPVCSPPRKQVQSLPLPNPYQDGPKKAPKVLHSNVFEIDEDDEGNSGGKLFKHLFILTIKFNFKTMAKNALLN